MTLVGFLTGLYPNLVTNVLENVFSPQIMNISGVLLPLGTVAWGFYLGLPVFPKIPAWI